jgi:hypothetical protein
MTDYHFDRIARILSSAGSRRQTLAALAALALTRPASASAASQIETAACGEAGAVCTQVKGCCSGLVCATSYTNPAYGVCVTGEGDMLAVSDDIVVPGAEGITDELTQEVTDASAGATDAESALDARATEMQSRQDARRTRIQTHRAKARSRKDSNRLSSGTNDFTDYTDYLDRLNRAPRLEFEWFGNIDATDQPETLRVYNKDSDDVVLSFIQSIGPPDAFFKPDVDIVISAGTTYRLKSGTNEGLGSTTGEMITVWAHEDVCPGGKGVILTVAQSGSTKTHDIPVPCQVPDSPVDANVAASQSGKKTRNTRRDQKRSKRGKGR